MIVFIFSCCFKFTKTSPEEEIHDFDVNAVSPEATELDDPKHSVYKKNPADAKFMSFFEIRV